MKSTGKIAKDILASGLDGDIDGANAMFQQAAKARGDSSSRTHSAKYILFAICLVLICFGVDALDGKFIDLL